MFDIPHKLVVILGTFLGTFGGIWLLGYVLQKLGLIEISKSTDQNEMHAADGSASSASCADGGGCAGI